MRGKAHAVCQSLRDCGAIPMMIVMVVVVMMTIAIMIAVCLVIAVTLARVAAANAPVEHIF
jgi:hypothetical protein